MRPLTTSKNPFKPGTLLYRSCESRLAGEDPEAFFAALTDEEIAQMRTEFNQYFRDLGITEESIQIIWNHLGVNQNEK